MFEEEYKLIGAKIVFYRKMKGLTQEELSYRASISASYLSRIERGVYNKGIPVSTLLKIATALEIDIINFFKRN